jgi:hypothetical protein
MQIQDKAQRAELRNIRRHAALFHVGNLVCAVFAVAAGVLYAMDLGLLSMVLSIAFILPTVLWFGASMVLYAFHSHHPNDFIGYHTRRAGWRFYAASGAALTVVAVIQNLGVLYYVAVSSLAVVYLLGGTLHDLYRVSTADEADLVPGTAA